MNTQWNQGVLPLVVTLLMSGTAISPTARGGHEQAQETKPLQLRVTPRATQSPGTIRVTATVERHPDNRKITIEAESGEFLRSSSASLDGAEASRTYTRVFGGLPPGTYDVSARLERNDGTELIEAVTVEVAGKR